MSSLNKLVGIEYIILNYRIISHEFQRIENKYKILIPEILEVLTERNYQIAIYSNKTQIELEQELLAYKIKTKFKIISGNNSSEKSYINKFCKEKSTQPNKVVLVEETLKGIREGKTSNLYTFGIQTGGLDETIIKQQKPYATILFLGQLLYYLPPKT